MTVFSDLCLIEPLQRAVRDSGYTEPTPIQAQSIPHLLAGKDLLGCARTGTGKTAAFALPMLQRLAAGAPARGRAVRALVVVPTRELAQQVAESLRTYGKHLHLTSTVVHGGVGQTPQVRALARGVDMLVATPGRLVDLMQQGYCRLDRVEILVLDEADHMLDLGFLPDVRRILSALPPRRQTLLFSATMPSEIAALADGVLSHPVKVSVTPVASTVAEVEQHVHHVSRNEKPDLLVRLLADPAVERALVFTRTKRNADRVARKLELSGVAAEAIHGNKAQGARDRILDGFRRGRVRVLVATDLAARGLDIDNVTHVINFELPNVPESYVHRIGRTARAGASGVAISLCDEEERPLLRDIERLIRHELKVIGHAPRERDGYARSKPARFERGGKPERFGRRGHERSEGAGRGGYGGQSGGHGPSVPRRGGNRRRGGPAPAVAPARVRAHEPVRASTNGSAHPSGHSGHTGHSGHSGSNSGSGGFGAGIH